ncbi:MAG TPA: hypothetical protein VGJ44_21620 [Kribbellaceae bacterium]
MVTTQGLLDELAAARVLAILRTPAAATAVAAAATLAEHGVNLCEVALGTPDAFEAIAAIRAAGRLVGAGTVTTAADQVPAYLAAGAVAVGIGSPLIGDRTDVGRRAAGLRDVLAACP